MKIGAIPENLLERFAMVFGLVPTPFIDTFNAVIVARIVDRSTRLNLLIPPQPEKSQQIQPTGLT